MSEKTPNVKTTNEKHYSEIQCQSYVCEISSKPWKLWLKIKLEN